MHLGVDYGTAWSKLILRDREAPNGTPEAFVVRPGARPAEYRMPSLVTLWRDTLYFGWSAEERRGEPGAVVYASVKMRMVDDLLHGFYAPVVPLPGGLNDEDLAVLTVFSLLQEGHAAATQHLAGRGARPLLSITLGVPMTPTSYREIQDIFMAVAVRARRLLDHPLANYRIESGLPLAEAERLVSLSRELACGQAGKAEEWVRSEAAAAMHWSVQSPKVEAGRYATVDIGAGTTSSSVFNIVAEFDSEANVWSKRAISFLGASCSTPGMDRIDQVLAAMLEMADSTAMRGREAEYSDEIGFGERFQEVLEALNANRRAAFKQGYGKLKRQKMWMTGEFRGMFLFGGGHRVSALREWSRREVWKWAPGPFPACPIEWPSDLRPEKCGTEGGAEALSRIATDLLVAYGLSFPNAGVFIEVKDPRSIEPVPVRSWYDTARFRDAEEQYSR